MRRPVLPMLFLALAAFVSSSSGQTKLGIDVLEADDFAMLDGQRVGLVGHAASRSGDLRHTADVLRAGGVNLVALYGPEHGVFGDIYAGDKVDDLTDRRTGLPIYSLYGATRKPTPEMLAGIDVMVYDLQDIGSRSYTYISTLEAVIDGVAEADKPLVVLDRPNPLGGNRIEGGGVNPELESFVSAIDIPYVHGMTTGELALLIQQRNAPDWDGLTVVAMEGWTRDTMWSDTGLKWVPTSPHIPHASSCWGYAATGILGELMQISNGVGYTLPFEIVGDPDFDAEAMAETLNAQIGTDGLVFVPVHFRPYYATHKGETCRGVQLVVDPTTQANLYEINFRVLAFADAAAVLSAAESRHGMFDKVTGSTAMREVLMTGGDLEARLADEREQAEAFRTVREPFLLYE
ncbi:MAG: DUF1343 domain-containing protein [Planctomycetota bacterium]